MLWRPQRSLIGLMVETSASHDGSADSNPVAGALSQSSGFATDV